MARNTPKRVPKRSPLEAVLSASIPKNLKRSVMGRATLTERPYSQLVRWALEYHEAQDWKDIPLASITPKQKTQLRQWLDTDEPLDSLGIV